MFQFKTEKAQKVTEIKIIYDGLNKLYNMGKKMPDSYREGLPFPLESTGWAIYPNPLIYAQRTDCPYYHWGMVHFSDRQGLPSGASRACCGGGLYLHRNEGIWASAKAILTRSSVEDTMMKIDAAMQRLNAMKAKINAEGFITIPRPTVNEWEKDVFGREPRVVSWLFPDGTIEYETWKMTR